MIRLRLVRQHQDIYAAFLDDELIVQSRQPIFDGARALLKLGFDPESLMTARHETSNADSFDPKPIRDFAKWSVTERDKGGIQRRLWRPNPMGGSNKPSRLTSSVSATTRA